MLDQHWMPICILAARELEVAHHEAGLLVLAAHPDDGRAWLRGHNHQATLQVS